MPHVNKEAKDRLVNGRIMKEDAKGNRTGYGELCYLFSQVYLQLYNHKPKWETVHAIRLISRNPFQSSETLDLVNTHASAFTREDTLVAADLAFLEFYRVVGAAHEDVKILENGNAFEGAKIPTVVKPTGNLKGIPGYLEV